MTVLRDAVRGRLFDLQLSQTLESLAVRRNIASVTLYKVFIVLTMVLFKGTSVCAPSFQPDSESRVCSKNNYVFIVDVSSFFILFFNYPVVCRMNCHHFFFFFFMSLVFRLSNDVFSPSSEWWVTVPLCLWLFLLGGQIIRYLLWPSNQRKK